MTSLIDIKAKLAELEERLFEAGGEIEPGSELERDWDATQQALIAKIDNYAEYIMFLDAKAEALRKASRSVTQRAQALENLASRLRKNADFVMGESGNVLEGDSYVLKRVKNPPAVTIIDAPAGRGAERQVRTTVAIAHGSPRSYAASRSLRISLMGLPSGLCRDAFRRHGSRGRSAPGPQ